MSNSFGIVLAIPIAIAIVGKLPQQYQQQQQQLENRLSNSNSNSAENGNSNSSFNTIAHVWCIRTTSGAQKRVPRSSFRSQFQFVKERNETSSILKIVVRIGTERRFFVEILVPLCNGQFPFMEDTLNHYFQFQPKLQFQAPYFLIHEA